MDWLESFFLSFHGPNTCMHVLSFVWWWCLCVCVYLCVHVYVITNSERTHIPFVVHTQGYIHICRTSERKHQQHFSIYANTHTHSYGEGKNNAIFARVCVRMRSYAIHLRVEHSVKCIIRVFVPLYTCMRILYRSHRRLGIMRG